MENFSNKLFALLSKTLTACWEQVLWLLGPLFLFGFLLFCVSYLIRSSFAQTIGAKAEVFITGYIGVPAHEMAHAIFCFLFRHKITDVKFLTLSQDETLGFVKHEYNYESSFQKIGNFFIGIAPIIFCAVLLYALLGILLPEYLPEYSNEGVAATGLSIFKMFFNIDNFNNWRFWLFLYLSLCISTHATISFSDFKGAISGLITFLCIIFLLNLIANIFLTYGLSDINATHVISQKINVLLALFYSLLLYALTISIIYFVFIYLLLNAFQIIRRRPLIKLLNNK